MAKIDPVYDQTASPSAGGTQQAGKDSLSCDDALGKPGRFTRNQTTVAAEEHDVKKLREEQLGSNGYQSNGFCSEDAMPAPRRGFKSN